MSNINGLKIEDGVLVKCESQEPHIVIPEGVTAIGKSAFENCKSLVSVMCPLELEYKILQILDIEHIRR